MAWEIAIVLTFVGIAFALFYAGQSLDKEHAPLKLLFLVIGLFLLTTNLANTSHIINANNETIANQTITDSLILTTDAVYSGFIWIVYLVVAYFIIYFLWKAVRAAKLKREE